MNWINKQLLITTILLLVTITVFEASNLDKFVQDHFYNFVTGSWLLDRNEPISRFLLYDGIKALYVLGALSFLGFFAFFGNVPTFQPYRKGLIIVSISLFLVPASVNLLKAVTNVPCPVNLAYYGGSYPDVTLLSGYPDDFKQERQVKCYPAGHASGGFALLSLFFLFRSRRSRRVAVSSALCLAWTVGGYKMLIGDHFLSHTLVTMFVAWLLILLTAKWVNPEFTPHDLA